MNVIKKNINGIDVTMVQTDKFKNIVVDVMFCGEFNNDTATSKSLISRVLVNSTKKYPSKKEIAHKLFDLYDASIGISTFPIYKTCVTTFTLDIINDKFLNERIFEEGLNLLREFIFYPNAYNDTFDEKNFNEVKKILEQKIKNIYNNKDRYTIKRLLQTMGKDEIISIGSLGSLEKLKTITPVILYQDYLRMIKDENVKIFVTGDFDELAMCSMLKGFIKTDFNINENHISTIYDTIHTIEQVKEEREVQEINQSKIAMGFRTNINSNDSNYYALLIFNAMYGGMFSSTLFNAVREENSLAYNIASQLITDLSLLIVIAGIDGKNYHKTTDIIIKELENYKLGIIDNELLEVARIAIINDYKQLSDSAYSLNAFYEKMSLHNNELSTDDIIEKLEKVECENIIEVAKAICLDTIFFLTDKGEQYEGM